jgi:hypothetical protein
MHTMNLSGLEADGCRARQALQRLRVGDGIRSNAPPPRVSTLTALAPPGGKALRKARLECASLVSETIGER